jgi:peptide/nickel transport system substrate-binding protein
MLRRGQERRGPEARAKGGQRPGRWPEALAIDGSDPRSLSQAEGADDSYRQAVCIKEGVLAQMKRLLISRKFAAVGCILAASMAVAVADTAGASAKGIAHAASGSVLTVESSETSTLSGGFNPFVSTSVAATIGATSLIYEPLFQADVVKPGKYYPFLATKYAWGKGGKSITFTIRQGVKWSDGQPFSAADVAFTYNLIKSNADVNEYGLALTGVSQNGNTVTLSFGSPQYANFQNIAAQPYIVPQHIWSSVGDPAQYADSDPVGTGPYKVSTLGSSGLVMAANSSYWGGTPAIGTVEFPTIADNATVLSDLDGNQLDWAGNFIPGLQKSFLTSAAHQVWFAPVQTNSLEPNLSRWPTNQLAVRQAISLAIDRKAISSQGESGLEPVATNASGLTLPEFSAFLSPSVKKYALSPNPNAKAAERVLEKAGYKKDSHGFFALHGKEVKLDVTDPANYSDYAADDEIVASDLKKAGINASFVGLSDNAWASDIATGNFQLTGHWSQTSVSVYQLYNDWLNSALATKSNRGGNFEGLRSGFVDSALKRLASAATIAQQAKDAAPIERYVAQNLPIIPTVYGAAFDEYNAGAFTGWPTATNNYESGSPNAPTNEVVILHLKPKS